VILLGLCSVLAARSGGQVSPETNPQRVPGHGKVTINVVVTDKQGHPVRGLTANDFTLTDNDQPQTLAGFKALDAEATDAPVHTVIVVDMVNVPFQMTAWGREELGKFLKEDGGKLANPTSLAVMTQNGLKLEPNATMDGNVLMSSLDTLRTQLRPINRNGGFYAAGEMLEMSLRQISQLAAYEAAKPGHKLILVISPGLPLLPRAGDQEDMTQRKWVFDSVVALTNGLREADITLYSLDTYELGRTDPFYYQSFLKPVKKADGAEYPNLGLKVVAMHSGGQAQVTGRDITGELNTTVRDATASYELTFESVPGDGPNEYHALKVMVGRPDVTVPTTAGYYANVQGATNKKK
jgi:VWFA-related protein